MSTDEEVENTEDYLEWLNYMLKLRALHQDTCTLGAFGVPEEQDEDHEY